MLSKGQEGFSNIKEQEKNSEDGSKISFDAPPLDFSFKNIKSLAELKDIQPRQGEKLSASRE